MRNKYNFLKIKNIKKRIRFELKPKFFLNVYGVHKVTGVELDHPVLRLYSLNDDGIIRFEWYLNEADNTATLIERFENSDVWEELGNKVLGSPINIKFRELFEVESLTVLGDINDSFKEKLQAMSPIIKTYVGGIN